MAEPATREAPTASTRLTGYRGAWWGLAAAVALVAAAFAVPLLAGWDVAARSDRDGAPPVHGFWQPGLGVGTLPALAVAAWALATRPTGWRTWSWPRLLLTSYVVGLAWLLALALVDGPSGLTRVLGNAYEYLPTARGVDDVGALLHDYVDRIPYSHPDNWVVHVAGHPPATLLFFVLLDRVGLGGDLSAALVVTALAATLPAAVLSTLRTLGAEAAARRAAPFLVLGPAAVFLAVSADAIFAVIGAWGLCALARAAVADRERAPRALLGWGTFAGLLLGTLVMMSYGMPLLGTVALAVLAAAGAWRALPVAALAALAVVLAYAAGGFAWWEAYPVLVDRYWDGIAADRPFAYWWWANFAALLIAAGPALAVSLGHLAQELRAGAPVDRVVGLLVGGAVAAVVVADLSRMSMGEVERIWLPFVPWLIVATALLPDQWVRIALALQLGSALVLQHLLYTSW